MAKDEASEALKAAAAEAGMTPARFVQLSGRTSLQEWEAAREADAKAAEGAGTED